MRDLGTFLVVLALVLLILEAIGERRATRWRQELKDMDADFDALFQQAEGRTGIPLPLWKRQPQRINLLIFTWLASDGRSTRRRSAALR